MNIEAILKVKGRDVVTVDSGAPVREAVRLLAEHRIGAVPVIQGGKVAGIMSERDVIYCLKSDGAAVLDYPVERVMTSPIFTAAPDMPILAGLSLMTERRIRHLPVVESGALVGLVSIGDLVKYRMDRVEEEAAALRDYIQSA